MRILMVNKFLYPRGGSESYMLYLADHLKKISNRLTLFGAIFLALLALIPTVILNLLNIPGGGAFNATGMLICVSVALEFNTALESQIMMKNYKGFLK